MILIAIITDFWNDEIFLSEQIFASLKSRRACDHQQNEAKIETHVLKSPNLKREYYKAFMTYRKE